MLDNKHVRDELNRFAKNVVSKAKSNLTRKKRLVSGNLYRSLGYDLKVMPNSMSLEFEMEPYGEYIDKGVKGAKPNLFDHYTQKAPMSKYSYRDKMPPRDAILNLVKKKRLRLRNDKGQFIKGGYNNMAFLIQRSIYAQGIKPSLFFTKPFLAAYKNLDKKIIEAYALDMEYLLDKKFEAAEGPGN